MGENVIKVTDSNTFQDLWSAHQQIAAADVPEVGAALGGKVQANIDAGIFENGCAIRLSHAFNEAGNPDVPEIPYIKGAVSSDAQKDWNIFRLKDMKTFMEDNYGAPTIVSDNPADFYGKQGIIAFNVDGWNDATGHIDLLDGNNCSTQCYFAESSSMEMWTFDNPLPVNYVESEHLQYGPAIDLPTDSLPTLERAEAGMPIYAMEQDGHFSENPLGNAFAKNFQDGGISMYPVYDQDSRLSAFYFSDDPESGQGFYVQPQDMTPHLQGLVAPNIHPPSANEGAAPDAPTPPLPTLPRLPALSLTNGATAPATP